MSLEEVVTLIVTRLVNARERAHMTQREVADALGVDPVTVSRWETQTRGIDLALFVQLCALYHVPPALLLTGEAESPEARTLRLEAKLKAIQAILNKPDEGERERV